jgi:hypothetical protein
MTTELPTTDVSSPFRESGGRFPIDARFFQPLPRIELMSPADRSAHCSEGNATSATHGGLNEHHQNRGPQNGQTRRTGRVEICLFISTDVAIRAPAGRNAPKSHMATESNRDLFRRR